MTYSIQPVEVRAVLGEVATFAEQYQAHIDAFEGNFQALATAAKGEALAATLAEFTQRVLVPKITTISGRTTDAAEAVGNAVVIVESADGQMADEASTAQIQLAQSTAGGSYDTADVGQSNRGGAVAVA
ncbi:DUF6507 family protein [Arthrobacter sp. zg-Y179]|uniref:DUF6507 family protein n=1 Tax=Arthrobacter sp. zg-Y179 TaxID=2894188 RepID=UPI001E4ACD39|nr:DUF6507 family protein [Arthrobacter sp. zg-Y179]MCC9176048.1 DUF6507 family protein [Arthrobacter sp. zg-Y179]